MLGITTWLWGNGKYVPDDVRRLAAGVRRHLSVPHRFICFTDQDYSFGPGIERWPISAADLTKIRGCFARLQLFQRDYIDKVLGVDAVFNMDLDTVVTGNIGRTVDRPEPFVCLQNVNTANPCPMNGAYMLIKAGAHPEIWEEFSLDRARKMRFHEFPDDQGWIWHMLPDAAGWNAGHESGIYVYNKRGWPGGDELPSDARLVTFVNNTPRNMQKKLPWIKEHWQL